MIVERTADEVILRLPSDIDILVLQKINNYVKYKSRIIRSEASEAEADSLAEESKTRWWEENKKRFIK